MEKWHHTRGRSGRRLTLPGPHRLLELRNIILDLVRYLPAHECVHGYVKGRGVESCLRPHIGHRYVMHLDLCSFFRSIPKDDVVSGLIALGLDTATVRYIGDACFEDDHLPVGPCTSPALSNVGFAWIDFLLAGEGTYTRYSDQLIFSDNNPPQEGVIREMIRECGYRVNEKKSWLRVRGRQSIEVMGWVIGDTSLRRPRRVLRRERAERFNSREG